MTFVPLNPFVVFIVIPFVLLGAGIFCGWQFRNLAALGTPGKHRLPGDDADTFVQELRPFASVDEQNREVARYMAARDYEHAQYRHRLRTAFRMLWQPTVTMDVRSAYPANVPTETRWIRNRRYGK